MIKQNNRTKLWNKAIQQKDKAIRLAKMVKHNDKQNNQTKR